MIVYTLQPVNVRDTLQTGCVFERPWAESGAQNHPHVSKREALDRAYQWAAGAYSARVHTMEHSPIFVGFSVPKFNTVPGHVLLQLDIPDAEVLVTRYLPEFEAPMWNWALGEHQPRCPGFDYLGCTCDPDFRKASWDILADLTNYGGMIQGVVDRLDPAWFLGELPTPPNPPT